MTNQISLSTDSNGNENSVKPLLHEAENPAQLQESVTPSRQIEVPASSRRLVNQQLRTITDHEEYNNFMDLPRDERLRQFRCFFKHIKCSVTQLIALASLYSYKKYPPASEIADCLHGYPNEVYEKKIAVLYLNMRYHPELLLRFSNQDVNNYIKSLINEDGQWIHSSCDKLDIEGGECDHTVKYSNVYSPLKKSTENSTASSPDVDMDDGNQNPSEVIRKFISTQNIPEHLFNIAFK